MGKNVQWQEVGRTQGQTPALPLTSHVTQTKSWSPLDLRFPFCQTEDRGKTVSKDPFCSNFRWRLIYLPASIILLD